MSTEPTADRDYPDFHEHLDELKRRGLLPRYSASPEEATAYLRSEFRSWGEVVKRSGVALE